MEPSEPKPFKMPPPKRSDWRCPANIVALTQRHHKNVFAKWLVSILKEPAKEALRAYRVGTYPDSAKHPELTGAMVFWQIGTDGRERSGKVVPYGPDGKRIKELKASWVHSIVTGKSMDELGAAQVLFGEHLLAGNNKPVAVVESEKTSVIGAIRYPSHIWLATGGSHGITVEKFLCLAGRDVTFFPDKGMYGHWCDKAADVEPLLNSCRVSDVLEGMDAESGCDIGDLMMFPIDGRYENYLETMAIDLFGTQIQPPFDTLEHIVPWAYPSEDPTVRHKYPPALQQMVAQNQKVADLCGALDLDTDNLTITPLTP